MTDTLKVDTQQLKTTASEVRKQIRLMQQDFDSLQSIVSRSGYYWQGQAADEYRQAFAEQKDAAADAFRRLSKIPDDLEKMAGIYEGNETNLLQTAGALRTDFI